MPASCSARAAAPSSCTACRRTAVRKWRRLSSTGRRAACGTRRRTGSTSRRPSWPRSWAGSPCAPARRGSESGHASRGGKHEDAPEWTADAAGELTMVAINRVAPDFTLESDAAERMTLSHLKGKTVVLYFYPKDDTTGCTKEACEFRDLFPRFQRGKAVILG